MTEPLPHWKVVNDRLDDGTISSVVRVDHPDPAAAHALATLALGVNDTIILAGTLRELSAIDAWQAGELPDEEKLNYLFAQINGIKPRDQIESMLAVQMVATHSAMMTAAATLNRVKLLPQIDAAERRLNKLARTFTTQIEALKRYRSKGEQKVTVEHVHVHEGGQAIVGNVHRGVGGAEKSEDQPHEPKSRSIAAATGTTMPSPIEAEREVVSLAGRKRA